MTRITLTDQSGKWFDNDSAVRFGEHTNWNGNNHISVNTGSQWGHEALYYTKSGNWVLNSWSDWQGSTEEYVIISESDAVRWLCVNNCFDDDGFSQLPKSVRESVNAGIVENEV